MIAEMLIYICFHLKEIRTLKIISIFRKEREKRKGYTGDLREAQYEWGELKKYDKQEVKRVIQDWMQYRPLKYLKFCKNRNLLKLIKKLNTNNQIFTAVYSDYPAEKKLEALSVKVDYVIDSENIEIDALKPDAKGLVFLMHHFGVQASKTILIGDRNSTDGVCALNAGVYFLHVKIDRNKIVTMDYE